MRVHIDWSLLIVFALVLFDLGAGVFPARHPEWSGLMTWATAFGAALLLFASVLAHELSHAVIARTRGVGVRRITLFLFGGIAEMEGEPHTPGAELWIALAGPMTSLVIGVLAIVAGSALAGDALLAFGEVPTQESVRRALGSLTPLATLLLWLGPVNVLLALFNLIPGFPLDGGRVLRALLWWSTGDMLKATRWASYAGRTVALGLLALGVVSFFDGMVGQGLWLALIGWFLNNAARMSYEHLVARRMLDDVPISHVMWRPPDRVQPSLSLERFVQEHLMASDQSAFPVEDERGRMLGMITSRDVRRVPRGNWSSRTVGAAMTPAAELSSLPPTADAEAAFETIALKDVDQVAVVDGDHLEGLVRHRDLVKWISLQREPHGDLTPRA